MCLCYCAHSWSTLLTFHIIQVVFSVFPTKPTWVSVLRVWGRSIPSAVYMGLISSGQTQKSQLTCLSDTCDYLGLFELSRTRFIVLFGETNPFGLRLVSIQSKSATTHEPTSKTRMIVRHGQLTVWGHTKGTKELLTNRQ